MTSLNGKKVNVEKGKQGFQRTTPVSPSVPVPSDAVTGSVEEKETVSPATMLAVLPKALKSESSPEKVFGNPQETFDKYLYGFHLVKGFADSNIPLPSGITFRNEETADGRAMQATVTFNDGTTIFRDYPFSGLNPPSYGVAIKHEDGTVSTLQARGTGLESLANHPAVKTPLGTKYYSYGRLHRNVKEGPASIRRDSDGRVVKEVWAERGKVKAVRGEDSVLRDSKGNELAGFALWNFTRRSGVSHVSSEGGE